MGGDPRRVFWAWQRSEGTLSIHSITTQRREAFYWATVFATFALGTALGDLTAMSLNLGYLDSGILFAVVILIPGLARWQFGLGGVAAFWMSYVVTRPLGASFADYISKPHHLGGIHFGDGPTALVFAVAVFILVAYLALARPDIQPGTGTHALRTHLTNRWLIMLAQASPSSSRNSSSHAPVRRTHRRRGSLASILPKAPAAPSASGAPAIRRQPLRRIGRSSFPFTRPCRRSKVLRRAAREPRCVASRPGGGS